MWWLLFILVFFFHPGPILANSVNDTKFGIFYSLWHGLALNPVRDVSKIQAGLGDWGPITSYHWWGEPQLGYYNLSTSPDILKKHAEQLYEAGIDFVFLDLTNWKEDESSQPGSTYKAVQEPLLKLLEVWSTIPTAPKIVPWIKLPGGKSSPLFNWYTELLDSNYPQMRFIYEGKPLILGSYGSNQPDPEFINAINSKYTYRSMWAFTGSGPFWSYLQRCQNDTAFKQSEGQETCNQPVVLKNGQAEQVSVTTAYHKYFISDNRDNVPKFNGRTFRRQFETVFNNVGVPIVTITGWNEWIAQRFCLAADGSRATSNCASETFPDSSRVFVDLYDIDRNRDIEPAKNVKENYYYELMKSCISLYKSGKNCVTQNNSLCCRDYSENWRIHLSPTSTPIPTSVPSPCTQCPGEVNTKLKGDADCSGTITLNDYSIWRSEYHSGHLGLLNKNSWYSDYNCNGKADLTDALIWRINFSRELLN